MGSGNHFKRKRQKTRGVDAAPSGAAFEASAQGLESLRSAAEGAVRPTN